MEEKKKNHQLFIGPFQPELEEGLLAFLKSKKETDPLSPLVVLVGSNLLGLYLRRFLVLRGLNHINLRFLTFIDFAKALAAGPMNREGFRPLPRFGDLVVVSFLTEKIERGSYFSPIASRRGFQKALGATFRDLWDGGMEELPPKEDRKWAELNTLYQSYRSLIGEGFYNDSELLFRAGKESHRFPEVFNCGELVIYGFYDFTQGQKQLLQACANSLSFTAFMPWRETLGFVYASPTLKWYSQLGFQAKSLEGLERKGGNSVEVLQKEIFRGKAREKKGPPTQEDRAVSIIAAPSEAQEVREVAREILRLAHEEDIPFHEMAILLRNLDLYASLIQETFQRLHIPIYLQGGVPLSRSQVGKSLFLLLDLVGSNLRRNEVLEFLTFAPLAWSRFFQEDPSPSQWDLISREAGIVEGRTQWGEKLGAWIAQRRDQESEEDGEGVRSLGQEAERFRIFLKDFFLTLDRFPQKATWREMVDATIRLVEFYFLEGEPREAIVEMLRGLESLDALGQEVQVPQFQEILSEALEEKTLRQGFFQRGGVCVSDLMPARGLSFRAVFIPGLVERSFPAPARQDPLLLDYERQKLNEAMGEPGRIPLKRSRFLEERLLFSLALGAAREKLIFSYPRLDPSSGRERIPSSFLLRVGEALHGELLDYSRLETLSEYRRVPLSRLAPEDPDQAIDEEEFDLSQVGKALKNKDRGEVAYLKSLFPTFARAERLALLRWGFKVFTEYDGCLKSARARKHLRDRFALAGQILSPTKLEAYASCPFKYFLSEVLGLGVLPSPEKIQRIQPVDRGKVVHDILHQFYRKVLEKKPGPLREENMEVYRQIMSEVAARAFTEAAAQGLTGPPLLWELDQQELLEDLHIFLQKGIEEAGKMLPAYFEIRFGYQSTGSRKGPSSEPISLALKDGTSISFRGRIDRVDFSPEGKSLRVIDYKTGKLQGEEDGFCGGTTLQLPLYLMAACQIWNQADIEKSWAEYYCVSRKGEFERLLFRGERWKENEITLKRIIEIISRGIVEGTFFPMEEDDRKCGYCDFKNLCEHGVGVFFERKKSDPRAAAFLEMREIP
jgi:ATP-dependent helicase/DNAse subunit B